jgi:hypothetical protein
MDLLTPSRPSLPAACADCSLKLFPGVSPHDRGPGQPEPETLTSTWMVPGSPWFLRSDNHTCGQHVCDSMSSGTVGGSRHEAKPSQAWCAKPRRSLGRVMQEAVGLSLEIAAFVIKTAEL